MTYPADLTINLKAIAHNWLLLKAKLSGGVDCGAVVKADAYGLGVLPVVSALLKVGCRSFYVSRLAEALEVQSVLASLEETLGVRLSESRIYVLSGCAPGEEMAFIQARVIPVLISAEMLVSWCDAQEKAGIRTGALPSVLKLDTGMGRLGLEPEAFQVLLTQPETLQRSGVRMLMSHLACADTPEHGQNLLQLNRFQSAWRALTVLTPGVRASLSNSAGILLGHEYHFDAVRPGIGLFGGNPQPAFANSMRPVVNLSLPVLQVRKMPAGSCIGYGATHQFDSAATVAIIAGGYADGLLRSMSGSGECWIAENDSPDAAGWRVPLVGRVSMDSFAVDISRVPAGLVHAGTRVEVIGSHILLDDVGSKAGTVSYEILTSLGARYQRRYLE